MADSCSELSSLLFAAGRKLLSLFDEGVVAGDELVAGETQSAARRLRFDDQRYASTTSALAALRGHQVCAYPSQDAGLVLNSSNEGGRRW